MNPLQSLQQMFAAQQGAAQPRTLVEFKAGILNKRGAQ